MDDLTQKQKMTVLVGILMGLLLGALDMTIVGTAMPTIIRRLGGLEHYTWVATAYMLFSTTSIPIFGKLADIYGRKVFFILGIAIFLLGSALCGVSQSMTQLIVFRALQGIGGGVMMSNSFALIGDIFPPAERGKYQGLMGAAFGLASIIGPALGGFITDNLNWRWVFYVNLPLGVIALAFIVSYLPNRKTENIDSTIDYWGVTTLILSIFPMLLAFSLAGRDYAWESVQIIGLLVISAVMLAVLIIVESKAKDPVIPLSLFKSSIFNISIVARFLASAGMFGSIIFMPLFVQRVIGSSATNSGMIMTPMMLSMVFASIISGQFISRTGKYRIVAIAGFGAMAFGMFLASRMSVSTTNVETIWNMIVIGFGLGLTNPILVMVVQNAFSHQQLGVVTSAVQFFGNVGATIGMAVMGSIMNNRFALEMAKGIQAIPADVKAMIPPGILETLTSGNIQKINELVMRAGLSLQNNPVAATMFKRFEGVMKGALANSISGVFVFGIIITVAGLFVSFFLKEIPLRKSLHSALEEAGMELAAETPAVMTVIRPDSEPDLVD